MTNDTMTNDTMTIRRLRKKREQGYTLLEYCAGAAIIAGILWGALSYLGGNLENLLHAVGDWAAARTSEIDTGANT